MGHILTVGGGNGLTVGGRLDLGEGVPPFITGAANFTTDNSALESDMTVSPNPEIENTTDYDSGIISGWFEINRTVAGSARNIIGGGANNHFRLSFIPSSGFMEFQVRDFSGGTPIRLRFDSDPVTFAQDPGVWHHIVIAWDVAVGYDRMYIDDVDVTNSITNTATGNLNTSWNRWGIGCQPNNSTRGWLGCLSEVYMALGQFLDLDITANRRKFIDGSGNAVYLGDTGELPTGSPAHIYHRLNTALLTGAGSNQGGGGPNPSNNDFNQEFGTITACASAPPTA